MYRRGDGPTQRAQDPECVDGFFRTYTGNDPLFSGWQRCGNLQETSSATDFEKETYTCSKCGLRYHLYYDEMR